VDFLGYVISENGVATDPRKVEKVLNWPVPTKLREVRSFLGLCSYYRKFVHGFSEIAAPLHALSKKNAKFSWTPECQLAFQDLKMRLVNSPVLELPCDRGLFILDADASEHGIGAVLSQVQEDQEKVIAFASRLYSDAERNYCVT
jgi:RNase H-like domain found in reverse transcriptase